MNIISEQFQNTIKDKISIKGVGLHTGLSCTVDLIPAPTNYGIKFIINNNGKDFKISANIQNVISTVRGTNLNKNNISIFTVEHLLSALYALSIDNLEIKISSNELPILDGSSIEFMNVIDSVGVVAQKKKLKPIRIDKKITFDLPSQDVYLTALPFEGFKISYSINYPNCKGIPNEIYSIDLTDISSSKVFYNEISSARTFCITSELIDLIDSEIIKGANLDNGLAFVDNNLENNHKKKIIKHYNSKLINSNKLN